MRVIDERFDAYLSDSYSRDEGRQCYVLITSKDDLIKTLKYLLASEIYMYFDMRWLEILPPWLVVALHNLKIEPVMCGWKHFNPGEFPQPGTSGLYEPMDKETSTKLLAELERKGPLD